MVEKAHGMKGPGVTLYNPGHPEDRAMLGSVRDRRKTPTSPQGQSLTNTEEAFCLLTHTFYMATSTFP